MSDPLTVEIARLAAGVSALRETYVLIKRRSGMAGERLAEKLKSASKVVARATQKIEGEADRLIAREGELDAKSRRAFAPHHAHLDAAHKGLDELEAQLALLSNDPPEEQAEIPLAKAGQQK